MTAVYLVISILIFGILIGVHEFGHFITAKLCGVRVEEFALGMGPAIFKKQKGETLYSLRCLPIGGYCAMTGEDGETDDPRAFSNAAAWKRLLILCAGAFNNFLFGFLVVVILYAGAAAFRSPTIAQFFDNCPYNNEEGLQVGDRFYSIDGKRVYMYYDVSDFLSEGDGDYDIVVIRDGHKVKLENYHFVPIVYDGETDPKYGFYLGYEEASIPVTLRFCWNTTMQFARWVWMGLEQLVSGQAKVSEMSGVVGVVDVMTETGTSAASFAEGLQDVFYLAAFIAVNLAIMNMLPIPALDGGRVFCLIITWLIEKIFRVKVDPKYERYINAAGLALLMILMVVLIFSDVFKIITG